MVAAVITAVAPTINHAATLTAQNDLCMTLRITEPPSKTQIRVLSILQGTGLTRRAGEFCHARVLSLFHLIHQPHPIRHAFGKTPVELLFPFRRRSIGHGSEIEKAG